MLSDLDSMKAAYGDFLVKLRGLSVNSAKSYLRHIDNYSKFLAARGEEVTSASRADVEDWLKHEFMRGLKSSSRAVMLTGVASFYDFLVRERVLSGSPAADVPGPKLPKGSPKKFGTEALQLLFSGPDVATVAGIRDMALLKLMYGAGPRVSEICRLNMSDIHFTAKTATVLFHGKGAKDRSIKLLADPTSSLLAWRDLRISLSPSPPVGEGRVGVPGVPLGPDSPFFISLAMNEARAVPRMSGDSINNVLKRYAALVGIADPDVFVHKMRSTFATDLYDLTTDIMLVAAKMGHSDVNVTQGYITISETALRKGVITNQRWKELRGGL